MRSVLWSLQPPPNNPLGPPVLPIGADHKFSVSDAQRQPAALTQTLMVYQQGGLALQARFETDVAGLAISAEPGPTGDRWQATLRLDPTTHGVGEIRGHVVITTNDPEFSRVTVPVTGSLTN